MAAKKKRPNTKPVFPKMIYVVADCDGDLDYLDAERVSNSQKNAEAVAEELRADFVREVVYHEGKLEATKDEKRFFYDHDHREQTAKRAKEGIEDAKRLLDSLSIVVYKVVKVIPVKAPPKKIAPKKKTKAKRRTK
jgi:hypothetical protein